MIRSKQRGEGAVKITTGTDDAGWTELMFGRRARKDDPRIEAVGTLDELNAWLGLVKCRSRRRRLKETIHACQHDLFIVSSEFVTLPKDLRKLEFRATEEMVAQLEKDIRRLEREVKVEGCCFLIPGETPLSAMLDICRCVARKAERRAATLARRRLLPNPHVRTYLNRLSDLLFLLARKCEPGHVMFVAREQPGRKAR